MFARYIAWLHQTCTLIKSRSYIVVIEKNIMCNNQVISQPYICVKDL